MTTVTVLFELKWEQKKFYNLYELNEEQNFAGHIFRKQPKIVCVYNAVLMLSLPWYGVFVLSTKNKYFRFTFGDNNIEMI